MSIPFKLPFVLDGGLESSLHQCGFSADSSAKEWMLNNPQEVANLLDSFTKAGADAVVFPAFLPDLAGVAVKNKHHNSPLIGGAVYPSGLLVEPYGETSFTELIDFYKEQVYALCDIGVDFIEAQSMSTLSDMRAAVIAARKAHLPIIVTCLVDEFGRTQSNCPVESILITLQAMKIAAFGLSGISPDKMVDIFHDITPLAKCPLVARPTAGEPNPILPDVYELSPSNLSALMVPLLDMGVRIFGGSAGVTPNHISALNELRNEYNFKREIPSHNNESSIILASETNTYYLSADLIDVSDAIKCRFDMTDVLLELNESGSDVICVSVSTADDAYQFSLNAHMAALPIMFTSHNEIALKTALLLYQGRAMVDINCDIDEDAIALIAAKYGAVIY